MSVSDFGGSGSPPPPPPVIRHFTLVRADDQLELDLDLVGVAPERAGDGYELRTEPFGGYLTVTFPPQHVGEYAGTKAQPRPQLAQQQAVFPAPSVVTFRVPQGWSAPLTVAGVLAALPSLELVTDPRVAPAVEVPAPLPTPSAGGLVAAAADRRRGEETAGKAKERAAAAELPAGPLAGRAGRLGRPGAVGDPSDVAPAPSEVASGPRPTPPGGSALPAATTVARTGLRLPSRLTITPRGGARRFEHSAVPVARGDRTELWHTRLAIRRTDGSLVEAPADVFAVSTAELTNVVSSDAAWKDRVSALERFAPAATADLAFSYAKDYVDSGFDAAKNKGEALLKLVVPPGQLGPLVDVAKAAATGGLIDPSFTVTGLSRKLGPVGGSLELLAKEGKFQAKQLMNSVLEDIKLLGVFSLGDLIGREVQHDLASAPKLVTHALHGVSAPSLHWEMDLFQDPEQASGVRGGGVGGRLEPRAGAEPPKLVIDVKTDVDATDPSHPRASATSTCTVSNVQLVLGVGGEDLVVVPLRSMEFKTVDAKKQEVDVDLGRIRFLGPLSFVGLLADLIPGDGFKDPPALDVRPDGVTSSFSLPVPALAVGMFSLENITFGAALDLWFDARAPRLALDFATRDNPFRVTVSALGGGGFLGLVLSTGGLERLEGSLEFGAAISVKLGVASGSVSVMGGVHFLIEGSRVTLTGYLDIRGEVQVLGLVSVGVALTLAMAYDSGTDELRGYAELVVKVKVLFFKKTVKVAFERTFVGGNADPTFAELMAPDGWAGELPWDSYCNAFAEG